MSFPSVKALLARRSQGTLSCPAYDDVDGKVLGAPSCKGVWRGPCYACLYRRCLHLDIFSWRRVTLFIVEANVTADLGCKEPNMDDNKEPEESSDHISAMTMY